MFKTCLWVISFLLLQSCGPKLSDLNTGVELIEKKIVEGYQTPNTLLFSFSGDTHLVNYFSDLEEKIKTQFSNSNINLEFSYNLISSDPLTEDLNKLAEKSSNSKNYPIIANISLDFIETQKSLNSYQSLQQYFVRFKLMDGNINSVLIDAKLLVKANGTIIRESDKTAVLIHDLITQN